MPAPDFAAPTTGAILDEKYRLEAPLGKGTAGQVFRATRLADGAAVAVKVLLPEWVDHPEVLARFRREASVLRTLRHPSIVALLDANEEGKPPYLVMELVAGAPLGSRILVDGKTLPLRAVGHVVGKVLEALEAAHALGVVHRDLKPDNVMLLDGTPGAEPVKVLDFGLAWVDDRPPEARLTRAGTIRGTPAYMSPEQCHGRAIGAPADVYAVGVMLFELLAGERPFRGTAMPELIGQHLMGAVPPVAERGVKVAPPPAIEALVRRALAKKAEDRPTATELRIELAKKIDETAAPPSPPPVEPKKEEKKGFFRRLFGG